MRNAFLERVMETRREEQLEAAKELRGVEARAPGPLPPVHRKMSAESVARLRGLRAAGLSTRACARALRVSQRTVCRVLGGLE